MIAIFISAKIRNCNYMIYGFKTIQFVTYKYWKIGKFANIGEALFLTDIM